MSPAGTMLLAVLAASGGWQTHVRAAATADRQASPFTVRLSVKSATVDPSDGMDFVYQFRNVTEKKVACDLRAALNSFHFVFSPVDGVGKRTVCPGPFAASRKKLSKERPLNSILPRGGHNWGSMLNFPRDLLPGSSMDRDYPTPAPGRYDLTAVMTFPKSAEGWSGTLVTPPIRVTVVLSKKRKADLADLLPFTPEEGAVLTALSKRLRQILKGLAPQATLRLKGHTLVAKCRARMFSVHTIYKDGRIDPIPHGELGPEHKGFLLNAWLELAGTPRAADVPQDLRRPYWSTHINAYGISKATTLRLSLSYGSHTDRTLLKKLKQAVAAVAK